MKARPHKRSCFRAEEEDLQRANQKQSTYMYSTFEVWAVKNIFIKKCGYICIVLLLQDAFEAYINKRPNKPAELIGNCL